MSAIESYTGISRGRAKEAIARLVKRSVIRRDTGGSKPKYTILPAYDVPGTKVDTATAQKRTVREWIWLPNELVTGAGREVPPVELTRQTRDPMTLRLLVDLYDAQNLPEDGGIKWRWLRQRFDRVKVGQCGQFTVWGFEYENICVRREGPFACHYRDELSEEEKRASKNEAVDVFHRLACLGNLGLIEWVPYLFEGDDADAEPIHPYGTGCTDSLEDRLGMAAHEAGEALLTEGQIKRATDIEELKLVPVPHHMTDVQMNGVARLRYRPKTRATAAWWAELDTKGEKWIRRYEEIAQEILREVVQHQ